MVEALEGEAAVLDMDGGKAVDAPHAGALPMQHRAQQTLLCFGQKKIKMPIL